MKNLAIVVALLATSGSVLAQGIGKEETKVEKKTEMKSDGSVVKTIHTAHAHKGHKGHMAHTMKLK
ncbi:hypothetical protein [Hymenobacter pini]|uniref:hypothetical protein n=1 Tax=Hymenobacter pini TaxID=2880879 RepID=UPI001CF235AF|nr:hypothetical protein [Hymenobacter pini]MCA8831301.1 hypothetical protein [Hymenobacter pini]